MNRPYRLGDKDLPFSECDECGTRNVDLFPIGGAMLCAVCIDDR